MTDDGMSGAEGGAGTSQPTILYLDVDDEITSAAGRIRSAPEGWVAIVLPYGSRLATSRINFRLLAREAAERGRRISIVAPDASTRALAASAGLPVFASVSEFESAAADGIDVGDAPEMAGGAAASAGAAGPAGAAGGKWTPAGATTRLHDAPPPGAPLRSDGGSPTEGARSEPRSSGSIPVVGRRPGPSLPSLSLPSGRVALALVLVAGFAVVAVAGAVVVLPGATVAITPRLDALGPIEMEIVADPDITAPSQSGGLIPAQRLTIEVTASDTFAATGKRVETTKATGSVTFQNCDTGRSITVGSGAVVATAGGIKFATATVISVARASIFPFACKTTSVAVIAVADGPDGNVAASTISKVPPGYDSVVLSVTNPAPTTGGSSTDFPVVLQADVDAALDQLAMSARSDFVARVADPAQAPPGVAVFERTAVLGDAVPTLDPETLVGTEVATFELGVTATGTVVGVNTGPIEALAEERLTSAIFAPDTLVDGSVQIVVGDPTIDGELVKFPVSARASTVRTHDEEALKAGILGLPLRAARAKLEAVGTVDIALWPDWVTTIPTFESRVTLTIEPVNGSAP